ncbi:MAG TPA: hypothetical protein VD884_21585 [Ohtaekwangia sp.]|nr:hypothetical protein [Ohtaekwangia sp.]
MKTLLLTPAKMAMSWLTIIMAGIVAGTLDALGAIVVYSIPTVSLFQFIASAAFGQVAFTSVSPYLWWGIFFHYLIATVWATIFVLFYPLLCRIAGSWIVQGIAYAILIWAVMNLIVLPMTHLAPTKFSFHSVSVAMIILIVMVGLPIAYIVNKRIRASDK